MGSLIVAKASDDVSPKGVLEKIVLLILCPGSQVSIFLEAVDDRAPLAYIQSADFQDWPFLVLLVTV
ncbi:hypothetical protein [Marinobacter subterrani]|uniref:hypothetical protein n=1 Tax=Marinobacter subterrani TaxID=1658765 RepID=UPI0023520A86|nr:hypothetical protein [Marinobacter subterrani]